MMLDKYMGFLWKMNVLQVQVLDPGMTAINKENTKQANKSLRK